MSIRITFKSPNNRVRIVTKEAFLYRATIGGSMISDERFMHQDLLFKGYPEVFDERFYFSHKKRLAQRIEIDEEKIKKWHEVEAGKYGN